MTFLKMKKADGTRNRMDSNITSSVDNPQKKAPKEPKKEARLGAPPDGGFGWVVALSSFSISLLVDGVCFSFGIFFDDFRSEFKSSKAATSWIGSTLNGSYLIFGPIVSALVNMYGCRPVAMCGSVLASIAFFCSGYTHHLGTLILTFGFLGGIGFGLMYLPAIVIVGYYFERRRALATGIACCGSGIGAFLFAPFSEYLLNEYGWRGATWIISGLVLNGFMFALFYRPLPGPTLERVVQADGPASSTADVDTTELLMTSEMTALDASVVMTTEIAADKSEVTDPLLEAEGNALSNRSSHKAENGKTPMKGHTQPKLDYQDEPKTTIRDEFLAKIRNDLLGPPPSKTIYRTSSVILAEKTKTTPHSDVVRLTRSQDMFAATPHAQTKAEPEHIRLPYLQRKDIFYSGSIAHLKEYQELGSLEKFRHEMITPTNLSVTDLVEDGRGQGHDPVTATVSVSRPTMKEAMKSIFDFQLLKSPTFLVYGLSCFLCMAGFFVPFTYMPDHAIGLGLDATSAAFLISIIGITNTVGRVAVGFISDQPWADCLLINNVALMIGGVVTVFVPYYTHFSVLAIYSAVFGSAIAVFVSLRSIIMVELMGLEKLTTAFGFVIMFQGFSSLLGSPIAGALADITGNYDAAFYMAGVTFFLSGVMCLPLKRVARWETNRIEAQRKEERRQKKQKKQKKRTKEDKTSRRLSDDVRNTILNKDTNNQNHDNHTNDTTTNTNKQNHNKDDEGVEHTPLTPLQPIPTIEIEECT